MAMQTAATLRALGVKKVTIEDCMPQWGESFEADYDELAAKIHGLAGLVNDDTTDVPEWAK